jgi:hypothetical protein
MAENNRNNENDTYTRDYATRAGQVGTSASTRQTADQIRRAEETRLLEAARIQRQTAGASFAEQYQQARGGMMRQNMAGTTPGLTGGVAQQRTSEISGAQMRGLSQLSGQRAQTMRDIDYQALMAPREAFGFAQQQIAAQRDDQMFNLQMIQSRQGIIDSEMSDADKLEALLNTGMSQADAQAQIQQKNQGFFDRFRSGDWGAAQYGAVGAAGAATIGTGAQVIGGANAMVPAFTSGGLQAAGQAVTSTASGALKSTATGKFVSQTGVATKLTLGTKKAGLVAGLKGSTVGKGITGIVGKKIGWKAGLKLAAGAIGFKFVAAAAIIGLSAWAIKSTIDHFNNK